jgi:hypothetical protein
MSPLAFLRALDGRAILLAALVAFVAPVPVGLLFWAVSLALTGEAESAYRTQAIVSLIAYFAAPFIGAGIAARFAKSLPLANGMIVALIAGVLALFLGYAESAWFPVVVVGVALGAGAVGAVIGRALRPNRVDI